MDDLKVEAAARTELNLMVVMRGRVRRDNFFLPLACSGGTAIGAIAAIDPGAGQEFVFAGFGMPLALMLPDIGGAGEEFPSGALVDSTDFADMACVADFISCYISVFHVG